MIAPTYDAGRMALMLNELRLPTIGRLWSEFAQRSDKEGWQASQLLGALFEHELAERAKTQTGTSSRRITIGSDQDPRRVRLQHRAHGIEGTRHGASHRRCVARKRRHDFALRAART